ncbi:sugar transferase [uncultured Brevundimonas sp.]|uniref:sugar transferase n=1 Tax=uncultured Brevundimonas sp. TaxID=213418 RepID=UPI0025CE424D|nr:sugar transferase [uncultured Brevundimonas sp.]
MKSFDMAAIRLLDICAGLFGGLLALPIVLVAGVMVRRDSPGPALFRQVRVGRHQQPFVCYKLRTMAEGTQAVGTHEVSAASVTPLGRTLRRLKIDELPQLWNVLKGEMSLVGPRPCLPVQTELVQARQALGVYEARPGVTGRAQVIGLDMSTPVELAREDAIWTAHPNLKDYLRLVLMTVVGSGQGDRVRG